MGQSVKACSHHGESKTDDVLLWGGGGDLVRLVSGRCAGLHGAVASIQGNKVGQTYNTDVTVVLYATFEAEDHVEICVRWASVLCCGVCSGFVRVVKATTRRVFPFLRSACVAS